jgi:hypothetical protein
MVKDLTLAEIEEQEKLEIESIAIENKVKIKMESVSIENEIALESVRINNDYNEENVESEVDEEDMSANRKLEIFFKKLKLPTIEDSKLYDPVKFNEILQTKKFFVESKKYYFKSQMEEIELRSDTSEIICFDDDAIIENEFNNNRPAIENNENIELSDDIVIIKKKVKVGSEVVSVTMMMMKL